MLPPQTPSFPHPSEKPPGGVPPIPENNDVFCFDCCTKSVRTALECLKLRYGNQHGLGCMHTLCMSQHAFQLTWLAGFFQKAHRLPGVTGRKQEISSLISFMPVGWLGMVVQETEFQNTARWPWRYVCRCIKKALWARRPAFDLASCIVDLYYLAFSFRPFVIFSIWRRQYKSTMARCTVLHLRLRPRRSAE